MSVETFRLIGVVASMACLFLLAFRLVKNWRKGLDYCLVLAALSLVFAVLTYAAIASLARGLPAQDYHVWYSCSAVLLVVALAAPWRWVVVFRRHS